MNPKDVAMSSPTRSPPGVGVTGTAGHQVVADIGTGMPTT